MTLRHPRRGVLPRGSGGAQRGAVVVEMAVIALFLLVLSAGAWDYGRAWRGTLAVTEASRTGARVGSAAGVDKEADFNILTGARSALASSGLLDQVQRVVIFQSKADDGEIPAECKTATSTSEKCNILTGNQFRAIPTTSAGALTGKGCISASQTKRWCPTKRDNVQLTADYVGVWIEVRYDNDFRINGAHTTIERQTVMRLEPKESF